MVVFIILNFKDLKLHLEQSKRFLKREIYFFNDFIQK